MKAQVRAPGPSSLSGLLPGSGALLPGLLPAFYRVVRGRWNGVAGDEVFEELGGVGLHAGEDVLVGLDGEGRAGVAESFAYDLDGDAGGDEQAGVGMANVVQADDPDPGPAGDPLEGL